MAHAFNPNIQMNLCEFQSSLLYIVDYFQKSQDHVESSYRRRRRRKKRRRRRRGGGEREKEVWYAKFSHSL